MTRWQSPSGPRHNFLDVALQSCLALGVHAAARPLILGASARGVDGALSSSAPPEPPTRPSPCTLRGRCDSAGISHATTPSDLELASTVTGDNLCNKFFEYRGILGYQRQSPGTIGTGSSTTHRIKTDGPASLHRTHHHPSSLSPHHPPHVHTSCTSNLSRSTVATCSSNQYRDNPHSLGHTS